jgi:hypothetical protein
MKNRQRQRERTLPEDVGQLEKENKRMLRNGKGT